MKKLNWDFITIVYDSGTYGRTAYSELHTKLDAAGICVTAGIRVDDSLLNSAPDTLSQVLNTGANGTVFFGAPLYARALVENGNSRLPGMCYFFKILYEIVLRLNRAPRCLS